MSTMAKRMKAARERAELTQAELARRLGALLSPGAAVDLGLKAYTHVKTGALVFAVNFNGAQSFTNYRVGVPAAGTWAVALDSDAAEFDGYARVDRGARFVAQDFKHHGRDFSVQLYLPARTVLVLERVA